MNPTPTRPRRTAAARRRHASRPFDTVRWIKLAVVAGASLLVLLTTCSAPSAPLRLAQAPAPEQAPQQAIGLQVLPTVTPAEEQRGILDMIVGDAPPEATQAAPSGPQPTPTPRPIDTPLGLAIDRYMNDLVNGQLFHGAVLVARDGQVLISKGYGMADGDTGLVNTSLTRFRLASVTKQFTAMAVLVLQARGKLSVDDPICGYLESCPDAWKPITIRNLLNHASGIVDYTDFMDFEPREMNRTTPQELVTRFRDYPLGFTPGEMYDYCNSNYVLLGLIIERASGVPYPEFMRDAIFAPLGMWSSGYDTSEGRISDGAVGYTTFGGKSGFLDASTLYAAGGLYSTVEDMWLWTEALRTERLVPQPLLQQMFTPLHLGYGFGWKIDRPNNRLRYSHAGDMTGVANFVAVYPEQHVTIIVLSNMDYADAEGINGYIGNLVFSSP